MIPVFAVWVAAVLAACTAWAHDPAESWLSYAVATCPAGTIATHVEAQWTVPPNPTTATASDYSYAPWFGIETTDNRNLLQPVNNWAPWANRWNAYAEYFQWRPIYNQDSNPSLPVYGGDLLHGRVDYLPGLNAYTVVQTDVTRNATSEMTIPVQNSTTTGGYKNFTIIYVVFEHRAPCDAYPPSEQVTFHDIEVHCDGKKIAPQWKTAYVNDICDFRAHVIDERTIQITWNTANTTSHLML